MGVITQTYWDAGRPREGTGERRQSGPRDSRVHSRRPRLCLGPAVSHPAPGKQSRTAHRREKPDREHTHTHKGCGRCGLQPGFTDSVIHSRQGVCPPRPTPQQRPREQPGSALPAQDPPAGHPPAPASLQPWGGEAPGISRHQPAQSGRDAPGLCQQPTWLGEADAASAGWFPEMITAPGTALLKEQQNRGLVTQTQRLTESGAWRLASRVSPHTEILGFP